MNRRTVRWMMMGMLALAPMAARAADVTKYDHVHLAAPDPGEAVAWYQKNIGAEAVEGATDRLKFGGTLLIFQRARGELQGSEGSGVDHIGFSFEDLDAKMAQFAENGVNITQPPRALRDLKYGFIVDPWGTKIEVMQDPELYGFHHIHLMTADPAATLKWYSDVFGGEVGQFKGVLPAIKYGDVWLIAGQARAEVVPTQGRTMDHLGWGPTDLDAAVAGMKEKGVKVTMEPRDLRDFRIAFIEGPDGTRIELVQR